MKILVINDQFERGGAARVAAVLCNGLDAKGYKVTIITDYTNYHINYELNTNIKLLPISIGGNTNKFIRFIKCCKRVHTHIKNEKPDVIISIQSLIYLITLIANVSIGVKIIVSDHTSFNRKVNPLIDFIRFHLYSQADALTILTKKDEELLGSKFPRKCLVYNPLSFSILEKITSRRKNILCAGRLEVWDIKGFDIIIKIWSKIHSNYPEWVLEIAGSSSNSTASREMEMLVEKYNLKDRVNFLGQVDDMKSLYSESSIFALPSRMEGFPMVLMEAMSQGCACIAFEIFGATNEMLDEQCGIIIPDGDYNSFELGLKELLNDENVRSVYSQNAIKSISRFSVESFILNWENLIHKVVL